MNIPDSIIYKSEKILFALRALYSGYGYEPYRMSKFEEYDLYANNKDFLVSDNVITFTDTNGKLMALKPDVTLSIIKNSRPKPGEIRKLFYNENVYRISKRNNAYREIMQLGLECFGDLGTGELQQVLSLAVLSMQALAEDYVLSVSDIGMTAFLYDKAGLSSRKRKQISAALEQKNPELLKTLICEYALGTEEAEMLLTLAELNGSLPGVLEKIAALSGYFADCEAYRDFTEVLEGLKSEPFADKIRVDFSLTGDSNYYNGILFKGFMAGIPSPVISGGQYDKLFQKMNRTGRAIGFAVYTDLIETYSPEEESGTAGDGYLNIALPKGRLGEKVYAMFARAGYECPDLLEPNRKLYFENAEKKVRYFWVKPSDVSIYVDRGAADIGVAGKDILMEYKPDVYELVDLKTGKCRMTVSAKKDFKDNGSEVLRVATKFTEIAKNYYQSLGRKIDIIHLNGSIELAPILGLSDVIVDIVETGKTLEENDLEIKEVIAPISARLIGNKSSYQFKYEQISEITKAISEMVEKAE